MYVVSVFGHVSTNHAVRLLMRHCASHDFLRDGTTSSSWVSVYPFLWLFPPLHVGLPRHWPICSGGHCECCHRCRGGCHGCLVDSLFRARARWVCPYWFCK